MVLFQSNDLKKGPSLTREVIEEFEKDRISYSRVWRSLLCRALPEKSVSSLPVFRSSSRF